MDDTINAARMQQQRVLEWALTELGLRVPVDGADQVARAIERAREIDRQVRAGLGGPFDTGEGRLPIPPLSADELEAVMGDLRLRYEQALEGPESDRICSFRDIG